MRRKTKTKGARKEGPDPSAPLTDEEIQSRLPYRWVIEVRRATEDDSKGMIGSRDGKRPRLALPFPCVYQAGKATHFTDEVLESRAVPLRNLPAYLRALADHYERVRDVSGDDAVVLVGRRNARYDYTDERQDR